MFCIRGKSLEIAKQIYDSGKWQELLDIVGDIYADGITEDEFNDLLRFEPEYCLWLVGL